MNSIEHVILGNLLYNEQYVRRVAPFLKEEFFHDRNEKIIFKKIQEFIIEYGGTPTKEAIAISLDKEKSISEDEYKNIIETVNGLECKETNNFEWLL